MSKPIQVCSSIKRFRTLFIGMFVLLCCTFSCKEDPCPKIEPEIPLYLLTVVNGDTLSIELDSLYAIDEQNAKNTDYVQLDLNAERSTYILVTQNRHDTVYFDYKIVVRAGYHDKYCLDLQNLRVSSNSLEIICLDYYYSYNRQTNIINNEKYCYGQGLTLLY